MYGQAISESTKNLTLKRFWLRLRYIGSLHIYNIKIDIVCEHLYFYMNLVVCCVIRQLTLKPM